MAGETRGYRQPGPKDCRLLCLRVHGSSEGKARQSRRVVSPLQRLQAGRERVHPPHGSGCCFQHGWQKDFHQRCAPWPGENGRESWRQHYGGRGSRHHCLAGVVATRWPYRWFFLREEGIRDMKSTPLAGQLCTLATSCRLQVVLESNRGRVEGHFGVRVCTHRTLRDGVLMKLNATVIQFVEKLAEMVDVEQNGRPGIHHFSD